MNASEQSEQIEQQLEERDRLLDRVETLTTSNIRLTLKLLDALGWGAPVAAQRLAGD